MPALTMTLTNAGLAKIAAAQLGQAVDLTVASVAFTDQAFVAAPTLTALPGEFRRIADIAGLQAGDAIVHLVVRDEAEVAYGARGLGLVLADGTLFAVSGGADRFVEKTLLTTLLVAVDIAFTQPGVASLTFGSTNFVDPPATTDRRGVIELATPAEVAALLDAVRAVTPATLKPLLDGKAPGARTIAVGGLAVGGGDLTADRLISVPAATNAEGVTGASTALAMTPASTKAAIDAAVGAVVNGAPGALNQLNELAAAMGNDPAFATTMLNALATKALAIRVVTGGGLAIGGGDLTADRVISVPAANNAEGIAGASTALAMTPASSKAAIDAAISALVNGAPGALNQLNELAAAIGNDPAFATTMATALGTKALSARQLLVAGLAQGGGDLTVDRTITVPKASAADVATGTADDRAVTPASLAGAGVARIVAESLVENGGYRVWSDGLKECWGIASAPPNAGVTITLPVAHTAFVVAVCSGTIEDTGAAENTSVTGVEGSPPTGFRIYSAANSTTTVRWFSRGV